MPNVKELESTHSKWMDIYSISIHNHSLPQTGFDISSWALRLKRENRLILSLRSLPPLPHPASINGGEVEDYGNSDGWTSKDSKVLPGSLFINLPRPSLICESCVKASIIRFQVLATPSWPRPIRHSHSCLVLQCPILDKTRKFRGLERNILKPIMDQALDTLKTKFWAMNHFNS